MRSRIQIPRGPSPVTLRPGASPIDTFTHPHAGQKLGQLADALSTLSPSIARFSDVVAEHQSERERDEGILAAQKAQEEGKTYREAISAGIISEHQSPWFRVGAQETFGRVSARKYVAEFTGSEEFQAVAESTDPKDFDKAEAAFREKWAESNVGADEPDRHYQLAFNNQAETVLASMRQEFAAGAGNRLVKSTGEAFHAEVFQTVTNARGLHLPPEFVAKMIGVAVSRQIAAGFKDKGLLNQLTANAIAEAAKRSNDMTLLDVMDHIALGGKGKLSGTTYGAKLREQAEQDIGAETQRAYQQQEQRTQREKEQRTDSIIAQVSQALESAENPHDVDLKPFREAMAQTDPDKVTTIFQMQDAWLSHDYTDNPEVKQRLFVGIHAGEPGQVTVQTVARAFANKKLTASTFREMMADLQEREKQGGAAKFFNDDGLRFGREQIEQQFKAQFGFENVDAARRATQAVLEFQDRYLRWKRTDPSRSPEEVNAFIAAEVTRALEGPGAKTDASSKSDFGKIPRASLGPTPADYKKQLMTDPSNVELMETEFKEFTEKKRSGLSLFSIQTLMWAGIRPDDLKGIEDFIKQQKRLAGVQQLPVR